MPITSIYGRRCVWCLAVSPAACMHGLQSLVWRPRPAVASMCTRAAHTHAPGGCGHVHGVRVCGPAAIQGRPVRRVLQLKGQLGIAGGGVEGVNVVREGVGGPCRALGRVPASNQISAVRVRVGSPDTKHAPLDVLVK